METGNPNKQELSIEDIVSTENKAIEIVEYTSVVYSQKDLFILLLSSELMKEFDCNGLDI